jgi:hypothetical protein
MPYIIIFLCLTPDDFNTHQEESAAILIELTYTLLNGIVDGNYWVEIYIHLLYSISIRPKGPVTLLRMRETYEKCMKINEIIFICTKVLWMVAYAYHTSGIPLGQIKIIVGFRFPTDLSKIWPTINISLTFPSRDHLFVNSRIYK